MERITKGSIFSRGTNLYLLSRLFERASFYGLISILILFMTGEEINMGRQEALNTYGWFAGAIVFFHIMGAMVSDLKLGNKNGMVIGVVLQAIGALILSLSSQISIYIGLSVFLIGLGLYAPNIQAQYGKKFLSKSKLIDAGFMLLIIAGNFGRAIGSNLIPYIGGSFKFSFGLIVIAILSMCSLVFLAFIPSESNKSFKNPGLNLSINLRIVLLTSVIASVSIYWLVKTIGDVGFEFQATHNILEGLESLFELLVPISALIFWSYFYYNQTKKLAIGFALTAIGFGMLVLLAEDGASMYFAIYGISILLLAVGEVHISPIILSMATKYSNPKYLATTISLAMLPMTGLTYLFQLFSMNAIAENNAFWPFAFSGIVLGLFALLILIFLKSNVGKFIQ